MRSLFGFEGSQAACNAYDLCILEEERRNKEKKEKDSLSDVENAEDTTSLNNCRYFCL